MTGNEGDDWAAELLEAFDHHRCRPGPPPVRRTIVEMLKPPPEDVLRVTQAIADVRARKEAAVDCEDFQAAADFRDEEKGLLAERAVVVVAWADRAGGLELAEAVLRGREVVDTLAGLLAAHGIALPTVLVPSDD